MRRSAPDAGGGPGDRHLPSSPDPAALLEVGAVAKPHGLRGDVIVSLVTNREERVAPGSVLTTETGRDLVVLRSSAHQGRYIVTFDGLTGIEDAEALRGERLLAPPLADPDALWIHELIGSEVETVSGQVLGVVESVQANPASDLLVLGGGGMIPLRFVVGGSQGGRIRVEIPDGLLDLS